MLERKLDCVENSGADNLVATDCSCLMHMAGGLEKTGAGVRTRHLAEVLAGALDEKAAGSQEESLP